MKKLYPLSRLIIISLTLVLPTCVFSQVDDAPPYPNATFTRFSETPFAQRQHVRANDPVITAMVGAVNADTLRKTLQELQDWGSRCLLNDDHKKVATWLMNKFLSYGYTDVKLDSFYLIVNWSGIYIDTSWQYNVVCTLKGSSAPDEIYVIGGHYDSFSFGDPYNNAPGVDDNGTSVASTLEIARVMANIDYQPEATIQFALFAAEELGLFGSKFASQKARLEGADIRFMFNIDMIAYNPDTLDQVIVYRYLGYDWAAYIAAEAIERYTALSVNIPDQNMNTGSDSYPYWLEGYPSIFYQEIVFNPYIHTFGDTLGNCNIPYFLKTTCGALATLAEQQLLPFPQNLTAQSTKEDIILQWMPTNNAFVRGFNIYRSDSSGGEYRKITSAPVSDSIYHDLTAEPNKQYYYVLTTVNDSLNESGFSGEATGARFHFCDSLLILSNLKGTQTTSDSVFGFYKAILDTIPFIWHDLNAEQKVNLALLSRYRFILWISNNSDFEIPGIELTQSVSAFMSNGGNLLFAGFDPSRYWISNNKYPLKIPENSLFRQIFRIDSVDRKVQSMLFRANAVATGYDSLNVDSLKYMEKDYMGQIYNIEVFAPGNQGTVIYRFDTKFDSTTNHGKMKHRPVGLEYMGTDFKSILLSFPLWYMDTSDARDFLHYVMSEKFIHPVGIAPLYSEAPLALQVYPNPVTDACNVTFILSQCGFVKITLVSMQGQILQTWLDNNPDQGAYLLCINTGNLSPGLYQVVVQSGAGRSVRKIVKLR
jgi:hypothetical protein